MTPDEVKAKQRLRHIARYSNPDFRERVKERNKAWRTSDRGREVLNDRQRKIRATNPDKRAADRKYLRQWSQSPENRERRRESVRRSREKKRLELQFDDFMAKLLAGDTELLS